MSLPGFGIRAFFLLWGKMIGVELVVPRLGSGIVLLLLRVQVREVFTGSLGVAAAACSRALNTRIPRVCLLTLRLQPQWVTDKRR